MTSQASHNLAALAEAAFHRLGDYESLVFEGRTYRSGELFDRACRVSSGLVKLGISSGERVVVLMANCPEVGITYSALWRAGAVVTPVVFLVSPPELQHILAGDRRGGGRAAAAARDRRRRRSRLAARARSRGGLRRA